MPASDTDIADRLRRDTEIIGRATGLLLLPSQLPGFRQLRRVLARLIHPGSRPGTTLLAAATVALAAVAAGHAPAIPVPDDTLPRLFRAAGLTAIGWTLGAVAAGALIDACGSSGNEPSRRRPPQADAQPAAAAAPETVVRKPETPELT